MPVPVPIQFCPKFRFRFLPASRKQHDTSSHKNYSTTTTTKIRFGLAINFRSIISVVLTRVCFFRVRACVCVFIIQKCRSVLYEYKYVMCSLFVFVPILACIIAFRIITIITLCGVNCVCFVFLSTNNRV